MPLDYTVFGGEVPKLHARNLDNGYGDKAIDVDLSRGTLMPWANDKLINADLKNRQFIMVEDCAVQASDRCISVARATLPCTRYFRTGVAGFPEQAASAAGPWVRLGMPALSRLPTVSFPRGTTQTEGKVIERRYLYTLVDIFDQESQGSVPSDPVFADWDNIAQVSGFYVPPGYPIKAIRLYSTAPGLQSDDTPKADSNSFFRVAEFAAGMLSYEHSASITSYGEVYLNQNWYEPPSDLTWIQHWGSNQLAGLSGGRLMFSQPLAYNAWPIDYQLGFHSPALAWVATEQYGYVLTCGMPEVVDMRHDCQGGKCHDTKRIEEQFPIIGLKSAAAHDNSAIYASADGLVMLTGNRARLITSNLFTREQWLGIHPNTMVGVVHDGFYFGATDNYAFRLRVPDEAYEANPRNLLTQLTIRPTALYRSTTDRLFFSDAEGVWEWAAGAGRKPYLWRGPIETIDARRNLGAGEIAIDGNGEIRILKKGRVIWSRPVAGDTSFRLPTWANGYDVQVEITGTGETSRAKLASSMSVLATLR